MGNAKNKRKTAATPSQRRESGSSKSRGDECGLIAKKSEPAPSTVINAGSKTAAPSQEQPLLREITTMMPKVAKKMATVNDSIAAVNKCVQSAGAVSQAGTRQKDSLAKACEKHVKIAYDELDHIKEVLEKIQAAHALEFCRKRETISNIAQLTFLLDWYAQRVPLWISPNSEPAPLVGAVEWEEGVPIPAGYLVAAYVEEQWVLAEVANSAEKLDVREVDFGSGKVHESLSSECVVPLPRYRANPVTHGHALLAKNSKVLALYTQTTVFYPGFVASEPPNASAGYSIVFEDEDSEAGFTSPIEVPQCFVVPFKSMDTTTKPKKPAKQ